MSLKSCPKTSEISGAPAFHQIGQEMKGNRLSEERIIPILKQRKATIWCRLGPSRSLRRGQVERGYKSLRLLQLRLRIARQILICCSENLVSMAKLRCRDLEPKCRPSRFLYRNPVARSAYNGSR